MSYGGGSGSGSGSIHADSDVALNNPSDRQFLGYNASLAKWQNAALAVTDSDVSAISESKITNLVADLASRAKTTLGGQEQLQTIANSGSAVTINIANANIFSITLTANCTFTLSGASSNGAGVTSAITLFIKQDSTGSRTITWPSSVKWSGGSAPTLTTTAAKTDIFSLISLDAGTSWFGFVSGTNY